MQPRLTGMPQARDNLPIESQSRPLYSLKPFQKKALDALESSGHVICVAPTGSGKSLIFERFATRPGVRMLLVTPLVALARQQADRLRESGVEVCLGAGNAMKPSGQSQAWIISPEMMTYSTYRQAFREWSPNFLVVDECHCLWEWGQDFRPAFREMPGLIGDPENPIQRSLWLTATLPPEARQNLRELLPQPLTEIGEFDLPESLDLNTVRVPWINRALALATWIKSRPEPGIVFVMTRDSTERVARVIRSLGRPVVTYHAGMSREERRAIEAQVTSGANTVVVATSAFGMGMNFTHLEWVLLWQTPPSLLSLAQAVGRVARGAGRGRAVVLWDEDDFRLLEWTVGASDTRRRELKNTLSYLKSSGCKRSELKEYFSPASQ